MKSFRRYARKRALTAVGALVCLAAAVGHGARRGPASVAPPRSSASSACSRWRSGSSAAGARCSSSRSSFVVADYAGALLDTGKIDAWAPLVAAAFLATGELAYTSIEPPARRVWPFSFGMVVAAAGVAALLLGAAGAGGGHLLDLALGMLAAAGALAIVARLASTAPRS